MQDNHNIKELSKFDLDEADSQTLKQCVEVYKQLQGALSIRKKLNIIDDEYESFNQSDLNKNLSPYKQLIKQYLQLQVTSNISLESNNYLSVSEQHFIQSSPQISQNSYKIQQLITLNQQIQQKNQQMCMKQSQYKQLMKKHYKFVRPNKPQELFQKFVKDKLLKNITNLQHEIHEVYEIGGRSSISSSSYGGNHAIDWINQEKEDKLLKQQEKILEEIRAMEKELQTIE